MAQQKRQKLRLTLEHFRFVAQYVGVLFVALICPRLPERIAILPGISGSRRWLTLWAFLLLALASLFDRALLRATQKDREERQAHLRGGGLNRSTLLALGVPLLFVADIAAIANLYFAYFHSGASAPQPDATLRTAIAATGCVLYIYGCRLRELCFKSPWGIRTRKTLSSHDAWATVHRRASVIFRVLGLLTLLLSVFLPSPLLNTLPGN